MRILLDTNVIIDVLQKREPWWRDGSSIIHAAAANEITACLTAKQLADIHFFSRKQFKGMENVDARARQVTSRLLSLLELIDAAASDCQDAYGISNNDYEDAMLIAAAKREQMDAIVTRNAGHFAASAVPVFSPSDFCAKLLKEKGGKEEGGGEPQ